jgi:hypothetical protein
MKAIKFFFLFIILIVAWEDHTGLPWHVAGFCLHWALGWQLHSLTANLVRLHGLVPLALGSAKVEAFLSHMAMSTAWAGLRLLVYSGQGTGGSYLVACFSILLLSGLTRVILCLFSDELIKKLQVRESVYYFALIVYICTAIIISDWVMGSMHNDPWLHIAVTAISVCVIIYRSVPSRWTFPITFLTFTLPLQIIVITSVVFAGLMATNPSWAFVERNTKMELLQRLGAGEDFILHPKQVCTVEDARKLSNESYPLILKPGMCTTSNKGVRPVTNVSEVLEYLESSPIRGPSIQRGGCFTMAQRMLVSKKEFVIFYMRYPYQNRGFIKVLGERGRARVKGNGSVDRHYDKAYFGDYFFSKLRYDLVSPELLAWCDKLSHNLPGGWNSGRLDLKVKADEDLKHVRNIGILEINLNAIGDIAEKPLFPWNENEPTLKEIHSGIVGMLRPVRQVRTILVQLYIGWYNLLSGNLPPSLFFARLPILIGRAELCQANYIEHLWGRE